MAINSERINQSFWRSIIRDALEIDSLIISKAIDHIARCQRYPTGAQPVNAEEAGLFMDLFYSVCISLLLNLK